MTTAVISSKSKKDIAAFCDFAKKMGLKAKILTEEEKEDKAFFALIQEGLKTKTVSRASVMKILHKK